MSPTFGCFPWPAAPAVGCGVVVVTGSLISTLVPSLSFPVRSDVARSPRTAPRWPLPVAGLINERRRSTVYGPTAVDGRGRVADQTVTRALGWQPGDRLTIRVTKGLITVTADADGQLAMSRQGRVHLRSAA